jgi:hypothetical protein
VRLLNDLDELGPKIRFALKNFWKYTIGFQNVVAGVAGVAGCCMTQEAHLDIGYDQTPQRQPVIGGHIEAI